MNQKKINYILLFSILIVILLLIFIFIKFFNKNNSETNNIIYELTYYDNTIPGSKYDITIYDEKVKISKTTFCSAKDCEENDLEVENFNYSETNITKLKDFFEENFDSKTKEIHADDLTEYQNSVMNGITLGEYFFEIAVEEYKYKLIYRESNTIEYDFYFKEDDSIIAKKLLINDNYDIEKINTYKIEFKVENIKVLFDYIEELAKENDETIIYRSATMYKNEEAILNSLTKNDESYLENIEKETILSYEIKYSGINCQTPVLRLYSDNSYEYFYTFSINDQPLIPKTGVYNYDINKIIDNIDKYEENRFGPYTITDKNGKVYTTYNSNKELMEFLDSIDIELERCLSEQE